MGVRVLLAEWRVWRHLEEDSMKLPGFAADAALRPAGGRYRSPAGHAPAAAPNAVAAQLTGRRFGGGFRGGFGTIGDYWPCRDACATAHAACLDGCEGTVDSPKASRNCIICDDQYFACLANCTRDIA
jgi:hypothetical protein